MKLLLLILNNMHSIILLTNSAGAAQNIPRANRLCMPHLIFEVNNH